jgi:hypothetical protein
LLESEDRENVFDIYVIICYKIMTMLSASDPPCLQGF